MQDLHHIIEICIAPLGDIAMKGMPCKSSNRNGVLLQLMLTSNSAEISKAEGLFRLKRSSRTPAPCYLCTAKRETFSLLTTLSCELFPKQKRFWKDMKTHRQDRKLERVLTNYQCFPFFQSFSRSRWLEFILLFIFMLSLESCLCACYLLESVHFGRNVS